MDLIRNSVDGVIVALMLCGLAGALAYALIDPEEGIQRRIVQAVGAMLAAVFMAEPLAAYLAKSVEMDPERALIASSFGIGMLAPMIIKAVQKRLGLK